MLMAARLLALRLLLLPGMWAIPGPGGATPSPRGKESQAPNARAFPAEPSLQLTGSGCRCAGMLEAKWKGRWSRVCRDSVSEAGADNICRWLGCGPPIAKPLEPVFTGGKEPHAWLLRCLRPAATPLGCHWVPGNCTEHAVLACSEPVQTTPEPPPAPPTTSPEPTGPPRLRLVDGNFSCSGFVELHRQGLWGAVAGSQGIWPKLATRICQDLSCGTAIDSRSHAKPERGSHLPVRWEAVESCESRPLLDCFNRTSARWGKAPAFVLCSGESSPRHSPSPSPGPPARPGWPASDALRGRGLFSLLRRRESLGGNRRAGCLPPGWRGSRSLEQGNSPIPVCPVHPVHPLLLFLSCVRRQNRKSPRRARFLAAAPPAPGFERSSAASRKSRGASAAHGQRHVSTPKPSTGVRGIPAEPSTVLVHASRVLAVEHLPAVSISLPSGLVLAPQHGEPSRGARSGLALGPAICPSLEAPPEGFGGLRGCAAAAGRAGLPAAFPTETAQSFSMRGPGSQPQALWRLVAGPTPCEGDVEVFHQGQWQVLCDNRAQRAKRGRQLCQQLRCGNLSSSTEVRDPPSTGVTCEVPTLHLCPASLGTPRTCSRTRVVCQDSKPHPAGVAAGTVVSICLALLLFGILSLICGPPAYRRLMKRISKKKQRQWIGPTGLNQTVSFHRNSTVTLRPRAEGQRAQGGDNDYAQPPQKSSYLSAYPALEGACRASNPPDNSSDSDYDLHSARRV
ncbi:hypothetical protein QYF61_019993 [Mycteria americana]|uniref:SRCR domain-containing protein n=1 Tax=Mycteria americana TaxID=33587 RepID=A0AAN7NUT3_MYCAM|nr:hypothetical protein QYF61_019993 [Mycteria americana]